MTGQCRVRIAVGARDFSLLQNVQTGSGAHPVSYSLHTGVLSWGYSGWGMKFTTHQCLVLRLRMSGAVPLLPYALMAWTMKPVFFFFLLCCVEVIVFLLLLAFFEFYAD
jgi:hypothetical protein